MSNLTGIQITDLTPAPSLAGTTEFPLQRVGVARAEKTTLNNLSTYLLTSSSFTNYLDTGINQKITTHIAENDPHGDRAYSDVQINTHKNAIDPHGDRVFTTQAITAHKADNDPHGDRAFTLTNIASSILTHKNATDPHGDRAYSDVKLLEAKSYTDVKINEQVTNKLGITIAPLSAGIVPLANLPSLVTFSSRSSFPPTGNPSFLYVDTNANILYRWATNNYTPVGGGSNEGLGTDVTTDDIPEGSNINRRYLTAAKDAEYTNKISDVVSIEGYGYSLVKNKENNIVNIKALIGESSIQVVENEDSLILTDNTYHYTATTNSDLLSNLSFDDDLDNKLDDLEDLSDNYFYELSGEVFALEVKEIGDSRFISKTEKINITSYVGNGGVFEETPQVTTATINAAGTVITGTALANKQVSVYNASGIFVSSGYVSETGTFTVNLPTPTTDGSPLYVSTIDGTGVSKPLTLFSPRLNVVRDASIITVDSTGLIVKGRVEKNASIVLLYVNQGTLVETNIGTGTANADGYFTITSNRTLITDDFIKIKVTSGSVTEETWWDVIISENEVLENVDIDIYRRRITGKGEVGSRIRVVSDGTILSEFVIDSSGMFEKALNTLIVEDEEYIPDFYNVVIVGETEADDLYYEYNLLPYADINLKPKDQVKLVSSRFEILDENISHQKDLTNFYIESSLVNGHYSLKVKNTDGVLTNWIAKIKINKIEI